MFKLKRNVSIAKFTTFRIGGNAKYFCAPRDLSELTEAFQWSKRNQLPLLILGFGSNILVSDEGFPGLVLKLAGDFRKVAFDDKNGIVSVGAALMLPKFASDCAKRGISGFECLCDIPGTIGAAVRINAGTKEGEVKDLFISTDILDKEGQIRTLETKEMAFGYRTSALMHNRSIVLEASFNYGVIKDAGQIMATMQIFRKSRRAKQPTNPRNCGSVFKSAEGKAAGWYIERCGLKGKRIGGAMLAIEHANWIVNLGGASSEDVKSLIRLAQENVKERFGATLVREVEYVPEDILQIERER